MVDADQTRCEELRYAPYFIDQKAAEASRRSLPVLISSRLCWRCRQGFEDVQIITADPQNFVDRIVKHCANEQDFLLPDTPMKEAIFRVLLGKSNDPMTAEQISATLSSKWPMTRITSPQVIQRLLDNSTYYCIAPASEDAILQSGPRQHITIDQKHKNKSGGQPKRKSASKRRGETSSKPDKVSHLKGMSETSAGVNAPGDPFKKSSTASVQTASPELGIRFERLLYWLSTYGEGTRQAFAQACMTLEVADDNTSVRSAFRRMQLLGHIDISKDGSKWSASPAAFVRFADDSERGFLAGLRIPSLLNSAADTNSVPQPDNQGPQRIETIPSDWQDAISSVTDAGSTANRLVELLPGLDDWKDSLQHMSKLNTTQFEIERWEGSQFQPCVTLYERNGRYYGQSGMYRLSRQRSGQGEYKPTLFFDEPGQRWLRGDWYGLRFLALNPAGDDAQAVHVSGANELLIPEVQRWPMLYERALVLASGLLPKRADNHAWLKYQRIPFELARTLCDKLNVPLRQETIRA